MYNPAHTHTHTHTHTHHSDACTTLLRIHHHTYITNALHFANTKMKLALNQQESSIGTWHIGDT
jgi:hypothetical protein